MTDLSKKTKQSRKNKKKSSSSRGGRRFWGIVLALFGTALLMALVSFIGSEKNWLGPYFGNAFPKTFVYVFGKCAATLISISAFFWGLWLVLAGEYPRLLRASVGFSILSVLVPSELSLASSTNGDLSLFPNELYAAGGRFGYFLVQSIIWPIFGKGNFVFPFAVISFLILMTLIIAFGLKASHFAFIKVPFAFIAGWWAKRSAANVPTAVVPVKEFKGSAKKPDAEQKRMEQRNVPEWNSDYTQYTGRAKPFSGPVGMFEGTFPVVQNAQYAPEPQGEDAFGLTNVERTSPNGVSASEAEIEEKERYLRENEHRLGALEVRQLRDEIANLRQVFQINKWEDNRTGKPAIEGIVVRDEEKSKPAVKMNKIERTEEKKPFPEKTLSSSSLDNDEPLTRDLKDAPITTYDEYKIPKVADILNIPPEQKPDYTAAELEEIGHQLEEQLENFKVKGKVSGIATGPMITRFEVEPGPGVKVSRFAALHEDLALALKAKSIRVLAPIPGKSVVGIEVPNRKLQTVYCRDIFESPLFAPKPDKLIIALGKDITGNPYTMDLCRAPHVLIAGQTGSGKSVCINTLMASLLFSKTPEELRMILVDPKVVELKLYENIPHLLAPVVTQPEEAVNALKWACVEMDRRYDVLAKCKVRNLAGYNQKLREEEAKLNAAAEAAAKNPVEEIIADNEDNSAPMENVVETPAIDTNEQASLADVPSENAAEESTEKMEKLPYIVIVIDELADLMMVAGKEVETYIARIAQKARAVGIHLVLATQRPSVNVITGLIKANLPARISFKVASQVDSRTVMDRAGAEKLLGRGDMLYRSGEDPEPTRVHGAFLSDAEVEALANACSEQNVRFDRLESFEVDDPSAADGFSEDGGGDLSSKMDALAFDVADFGLQNHGLSASAVQRRFSVGFSRAGKIIDQLERMGICGPKHGSKPREMLVDEEGLNNLRLR